MTALDCPFIEALRLARRLFLSIVFATGASAHAEIYQYVDNVGTSHFSDQPSDPRYSKIFLTDKESGGAPQVAASRYRRDARQSLETAIATTATAHRVEAAFLHAVIDVESGYNASAVSRKGAMGLMQLMPETARRYGVADPMNALQNLSGGARLLRDLLDQFGDSKELALAAYNAGAGAVIHYGRRIPPFAETVRYVPAVLQRYEQQRARTTQLEN